MSDVPRAAVIEAENLVGKVQALPENGQSPLHAEAGLRIDLQVGVELVVSQRALWTKKGGIFATSGSGGLSLGALLPQVLVDTRAVVSGS
ncbi:MAG: hypothetical protein WAL05_19110, partial [Candidatus Sulfotelmatobacter sp.]